MHTDRYNNKEYSGEEHFYNSEKIQPPRFSGQQSLWKITAFVALVLVAVLSLITVLLARIVFAPPVPTSVTTTVASNGTWQGTFTYNPGEPYTTPFQATLQIPPHQGSAFTGTLSEPVYGNSIVSVPGIEGKSGQFNPSQLQYVTQPYGNGTGTFITFTDPSYIQGNQIELNCSYIAVVYPDGSLHGVWFYPGDTQPDGTFLLNKSS